MSQINQRKGYNPNQ